MSLPTSPQDMTLVHRVNYTVSILSFFGSLWMAYFCIKSASPRSLSLNILLAIAISDFAYSVANIMSEYENYQDPNTVSAFCKFEGIIRHCSYVSSIYWTTCTAILCYRSSAYAKTFNQSTFFRKALFGNLLVILTIIIGPQFTNKVAFGKGPIMCWLNYTSEAKTIKERLVVRFFIEHVIVISASVITILGYSKAIKNLNSLPQYLINCSDVKVYKLLWYPTILFFTFVPSMIDNAWGIINGTGHSVPFMAVHVGITHAIGFINAIVYGSQRKSYRANSREKVPERYSEQRGLIKSIDIKRDLLKAEAEL